jgi:hypothetical protein
MAMGCLLQLVGGLIALGFLVLLFHTSSLVLEILEIIMILVGVAINKLGKALM